MTLAADRAPILDLFIPGTPRPQGSMQLYKNGGAKYPDTTMEWRRIVTTAVAHAIERQPGPGNQLAWPGPVCLVAVFYLPRPKGHYGTGRNADKLRAVAPAFPHGSPDLDKLVRLVSDSITDAATVWRDDGQVVDIAASKRWAIDLPGVNLRVLPL